MVVTTASSSTTTVVVSEGGPKGLPGTNGTDGLGFNQVRKSLLDNPLFRGFNTNNLATVSAPTNTNADITWTRSTSGTYIDRYGVVTSAAIDEPREESEGWLIEGASTNLLLRSEEFDNASWSKTSVTVTANASTSPAATATADQMDATASDSFVSQTITPTASSQTFSIWLRADIATTIKIGFVGAASTGIDVNITTSWSRFSITDADINITSVVIGGFASFSTGETIYAWGAQLEILSLASSYIGTTTASTTRAADMVSIVGANNSPLLDGDNTITLTVDTIGAATGVNRSVIVINASDTFSRSLVYFGGNNTSLLNYISGTPSVLVVASQLNSNKVASVYSSGSIIGYLDGVEKLNAVAAYTDITTSDFIYIGSNGSTEHLFGHVKDLRIYDFALNDDEVALLS